MLTQYNSKPQRGEILVTTGFSPWFNEELKQCRLRVSHENENPSATQAAGTLIEARTFQRQKLAMRENKLQLAQINGFVGSPDLKVGATKNIFARVLCQFSNQNPQ